jgi:hypothetical protein
MADVSPEAALAREEQGRSLAAAGAIAAGVCTLAGGIISTLVSNQLPNDSKDVITLLPALSDTFAGKELGPGVLAQQVAWIGDHVFVQALGGVLVAIASLLMLIPLRYLFLAVQARNPRMSRAAIIAIVAGCLASGVGFLVYTIAFSSEAKSFADSAVHTSGAARDTISGSVVGAATVIYQLGRFALALALVLVSLNAMRTGLLTRFFGVLGIIAGLLLVLPIDQPGIVRDLLVGPRDRIDQAQQVLDIGARPGRPAQQLRAGRHDHRVRLGQRMPLTGPDLHRQLHCEQALHRPGVRSEIP